MGAHREPVCHQAQVGVTRQEKIMQKAYNSAVLCTVSGLILSRRALRGRNGWLLPAERASERGNIQGLRAERTRPNCMTFTRSPSCESWLADSERQRASSHRCNSDSPGLRCTFQQDTALVWYGI